MKDIELRSEIARMIVELRRMRNKFPHRNIYIPRRQSYDHRVISENRQDSVKASWGASHIDISDLINTLEDWRDRYGSDTTLDIYTGYDDDGGYTVGISLMREALESDISYHKTVREVYKSAEYYDRSVRNKRIRELEAELRLLKENENV